MPTITIDLDTGKWSDADLAGLDLDQALTVAASILPGLDRDALAAFYGTFLDKGRKAFPEGAEVRLASKIDAGRPPGVVTVRVEENGELHSVWVQWPELTSPYVHSPSELVEVRS